jgi:hypothetical protein
MTQLIALHENVAVSESPFTEECEKILCTALHCHTYGIFTTVLYHHGSNGSNNFMCKDRHHTTVNPTNLFQKLQFLT